MKIIQSFWTGNHKELEYGFGWLSNKYHYLSWILSCNQLRKYYDEVELFTDELGYEILIKKLKLPYTKVHIVLDELDNYDHNLWALAKVKAYSMVKVPFLHVDGDVFIFEPFDAELLRSRVITQNIETTSNYYWSMWLKIKPELNFMPEILENYNNQSHTSAYNMGIFGGNDTQFIGYYADAAFDFVNRNRDCLSKINAYNFNIFFEQVLLYELSQVLKVNVDCLITEDIGDNEYKGFGNFDEVPDYRKYLHLLGFYKTQEVVCSKMDIYVQKYYPEFYVHVESLLNLKPKLSSFGFSYKKQEVSRLASEYLNVVINGGINEWQHAKAIYCRNIISEGNVIKFVNFIKEQADFYLIPLTHYKVDSEFLTLEIQLLHEEKLVIQLLSVDYIIFTLIKEPILYSEFIKNGTELLEDDFPRNQVKSFISALYKRISIFISYGVLHPIDIQSYNAMRNIVF